MRHFLLRAVPQFGDGAFSADRFAAIYEANLANGLGNLVSRLFTLADRSGLVSGTDLAKASATGLAFDLDLPHDEALAAIWTQIDQLNRELEKAQPGVALRKGSTAPVRGQIAGWLDQLSNLARKIGPSLPSTSREILARLGADRLQSVATVFPGI